MWYEVKFNTVTFLSMGGYYLPNPSTGGTDVAQDQVEDCWFEIQFSFS